MARSLSNAYQNLGATLDKYQELLQLPIYAFNGINNPNEFPKYECSTIWSQSQREQLTLYLHEAEELRKRELSYNLGVFPTLSERHAFAKIVVTHNKHVVSAGNYQYDIIASALEIPEVSYTNALSAGSDTVTLVLTDETLASEVVVTYPGELVEIPSSVVRVGMDLHITVKIPHLLSPNFMDNRSDNVQHVDVSIYLDSVDIHRKYVDSLRAIRIYDRRSQLATHARASFTRERAERLGILVITPITILTDEETGEEYSQDSTACSSRFAYLELDYLSGIQYSPSSELSTIRLAHTRMPNTPQSCPYVEQYWREDNVVDNMWTPYGNKKGAVSTWLTDSRAKVSVAGAFS